MTQSTKRSILRWIHILVGIPIVGYVYSPFESIPDFAPVVRLFFLPILLLSGLWLWKGPALRRLILRKSDVQMATE